jgi:hypothetical protein
MGLGRTWGRFGILGTIVTPYLIGLFGPTFVLMEGYPTVIVRAQGSAALIAFEGTLELRPGFETGLRLETGREGPRGYIDLSFGHYFEDASPMENQLILTAGIALGGP